MSSMTVDQAVAKVYNGLGKPGALWSFQKIKFALRDQGYLHFSDGDIKAALNKINLHQRFVKNYQALPRLWKE